LLKELKISNFALIETLHVSFSGGMSVITGETGAGKSILLGGLSLVLGKRATLSSVMDSSQKCIVEATFDVTHYDLKQFFEEQHLDYDVEIIIRREIAPSGKSRAFVNDSLVNLDVLSVLASNLIDVHSQHETQILLRSEYQFSLLDALAENDLLLHQYQSALKTYQEVVKEYDALNQKEQLLKESYDLKRFLHDEIEDANLSIGTQEVLERKVSQLTHVEVLQEYFSEGIGIIESEQSGVLDQMATVRSIMNQVTKKTGDFGALFDKAQSLFVEIEEFLNDLKDKFENLEGNPEDLAPLQEKLNVLYALQHKHKVDSVEAILTVKEQLKKELSTTENLSETLTALSEKRQILHHKLTDLSTAIHERRVKAIPFVIEEMTALIAQMGMENAQFRIDLFEASDFLSNGKDQLNFLFAANSGSVFNPLNKVASGGELSRIMLAIKSILCRFKKLPTIIFDEIDSGVSGKISNSMALIMETLANKMQVIAITHLPQVAAKGNAHFKVFKTVNNNKTETQVNSLSFAERVEEIAQMLSGEELTETALAHAKNLLNH